MSSNTINNTIKTPSDKTLKYAFQISISEDKALMTDYWLPSLEKKCLIGVREKPKAEEGTPQEKPDRLLVKSKDEYTSLIQNLYKTDDSYVIETENSIYIVSVNIPIKKIS